MKAKIRSFFAMALLPSLAGCVASQPPLTSQAADKIKCREYGFQEGTPNFSHCLMQLDQNRVAARRRVAGAVLANRLMHP